MTPAAASGSSSSTDLIEGAADNAALGDMVAASILTAPGCSTALGGCRALWRARFARSGDRLGSEVEGCNGHHQGRNCRQYLVREPD